MNTRTNRPLKQLKNIGKTVEQRLNEIGIYCEKDLARVGPIEAYRRVKSRYPNSTMPVCYYLYSLQGALMDLHWDDLPAELKKKLQSQVRDSAVGWGAKE